MLTINYEGKKYNITGQIDKQDIIDEYLRLEYLMEESEEKPFEDTDMVWFVNEDGDVVWLLYCQGGERLDKFIAAWNAFKTKEEAERYKYSDILKTPLEKIREEIERRREDSRGTPWIFLRYQSLLEFIDSLEQGQNRVKIWSTDHINSSKIPNSSTVSKMEIPELPDFEYQCSNEWTNGTPVDEIGKQVEAITKYLKNK